MRSTLLEWMTGEFENREQAIAQPVWFVRLRLWHRRLPMLIEGNPALFAEQANALFLDQPYRQRIVTFQATADPEVLRAQYFAFRQPEKFKGAGARPELLETIQINEQDEAASDLERLSGCWLTVTKTSDSLRDGKAERFIAQPDPDAKCCFQYNGETRQVVLGFEVTPHTFHSYDKGVDPQTGQGLWGALMGAYEFTRC